MNVKEEFPKKEEVEVIALKHISKNPKLSLEKARESARLELLGVMPQSLTQGLYGRVECVLQSNQGVVD